MTSPQEFYMFAHYLTQCSSVDISLSFLSDREHVKVGTFQMFLADVQRMVSKNNALDVCRHVINTSGNCVI